VYLKVERKLENTLVRIAYLASFCILVAKHLGLRTRDREAKEGRAGENVSSQSAH